MVPVALHFLAHDLFSGAAGLGERAAHPQPGSTAGPGQLGKGEARRSGLELSKKELGIHTAVFSRMQERCLLF